MQFSNTENNFKFSKGDRVKVKNVIFDDIRYDYFIGYVTFVNERYINGVCSSHWLEVDEILHLDIKNDDIDIIPYSVEDEREDKLNKILN